MSKTDKRPKLAGVIGHPIGHSRSPLLHNSWLKYHKIEGYYIPFDILEQDFEQAIRTLPKMGFRGVNVTIPYKRHAAEIADIKSGDVEFLGVANTLTFHSDAKIEAENTDIYGFFENLKPHISQENKGTEKVCILGAGGATPSVIMALLKMGFRDICLANRTYANAERLENLFEGRVKIFSWQDAERMLEGAGIVINTSSLGMDGKEFPLKLGALGAGALATDIVYTPLETPFLKQAIRQGARSLDGLGMLIHQAIPGFEKWFGKRPEADDFIRQRLVESL